MSESVDDKAHIRHELDLTGAEWIRAQADGLAPEDCIEYASVPHTDGHTYWAMRHGGTTLVFTQSEWDAFVAGVRDGEFDLPG
ncbi:protein of unknown function [Amycolatopsis xylanica]|uniref:DUF397 domain-containing protein n=1 Tax=Amycolatopsis xylanica TaxID=589385 RepID=A0A1H3CWV6_9PSEU|nr:DUF397 domain-containing protein [Amycolatopsis xylanica]SDX58702.1 protein of unknown function [Amycolatopsis xylanica]